MDINLLSKNADIIQNLNSNNKHTWCSGCGNFGISNSLKRALILEKIDLNNVIICYDIGCNGNESDKINLYTIHGLHGRILPLASGINLANPQLKVIANAGDGATFSEGINHLIHSIRNNYDITFILHNNENYGLTIGQASATSYLDQKMNGSYTKNFLPPLSTLELVLASNPTFVARCLSTDTIKTTEILQLAIKHKGFSYVEILQSCPTFNKHSTDEYYYNKTYYLDKNYDFSNIKSAKELAYKETKSFQKIDDFEEYKIPLGLIYYNNKREDYYTIVNKDIELNFNPIEINNSKPLEINEIFDLV